MNNVRIAGPINSGDRALLCFGTVCLLFAASGKPSLAQVPIGTTPVATQQMNLSVGSSTLTLVARDGGFSNNYFYTSRSFSCGSRDPRVTLPSQLPHEQQAIFLD